MSKHLPLIVKRNRYVLQKIAKSKPKDRTKIFKSAPLKIFNLFKTICKMIVNGKCKIGKAKRHTSLVKRIAKSSAAAIKTLALQKGGAFGAILSAVLPFLVPLISKLI